MAIISGIISWALKKRVHQIELFIKYPTDVQLEIFTRLIESARDTQFGKKYDFKSISNVKEFQERIPISTYEDFYPYIEQVIRGEKDVLWPGKVERFSKSSGTTNAKSKFIPITNESLEECHFKAGKDMLSLYFNNYPEKNLFAGKLLPIGGALKPNPINPNAQSGDVSAIIMDNLPLWVNWTRAIKLKTALMDDWEAKIDQIVTETIEQDVSCVAAVPTWTLILFERILERTGKSNMLEVWPNLELFCHGAVAFEPYRAQFQRLIPSADMSYQETYSASEGFFGIQLEPNSSDLLLMLDYGIFYEFIPLGELDNEHPKALTLGEVELNVSYAMVVSTNAGLWRYNIGDTIKFTSLSPFKIRITGRTKHFINAFGEELVIENAEKGLAFAAEKTNSLVTNYTAGPKYLKEGNAGAHEWLIEFETEPEDLERFTYYLDQKMRELNSDYDAKRYKDIAMRMPIIKSLPKRSFYNWMKSNGKLGGQNKVPRLVNDRTVIESFYNVT
jgi:hypothetical protein